MWPKTKKTNKTTKQTALDTRTSPGYEESQGVISSTATSRQIATACLLPQQYPEPFAIRSYVNGCSALSLCNGYTKRKGEWNQTWIRRQIVVHYMWICNSIFTVRLPIRTNLQERIHEALKRYALNKKFRKWLNKLCHTYHHKRHKT